MSWMTRPRTELAPRRRGRVEQAEKTESPRRSRRRQRIFRVVLAVIAVPVIFWRVTAWLQETPKIEPPFERIVGPGSGPIREFALRDAEGRSHTRADWSDKQAAVLVFLSADCPISRAYAGDLADLAREFGPRGLVFYGVDPSPGDPSAWSEWHLPFPIVCDAARRVTRQAAVELTPTAAVVLPDGQVIYRGRIDDRPIAGGRVVSQPTRSDLRLALEAILADEMPAALDQPGQGTPLPPSPLGGSPESTETITFNKHVAPILWNNCARCHRKGEVGPFPLLTYRDAVRRAEFIREVTSEGTMPPWKAHPGAGVFLDAPGLSVLEKEILARWAETGCAEGDRADLPPLPHFPDGWALGPPDLVLKMPEPIEIPPDGFDVYRGFALPLPLDHDVTVAGVDFHPGNRRVVHHSRIHLDATGDARQRDRDDTDPGFAGWRGRTIVELPYPGVGGWTPGMTPRMAPEGSGRVFRKGSDVVIQVHYHPSGKPETDQSEVGLYFARQPVTRRMAGMSISTDRIDIPPGEKRHCLIQAARLRADVKIYTVVPHAHYLCREFRLAATLPDGSVRPLLWIHDWNLDWQDQYRYARPVALPKGTILTLAAYFDNSSENPRNPNNPPRRVRYGIESRDEMCACHIEFLPTSEEGYREYPGKSPFGL